MGLRLFKMSECLLSRYTHILKTFRIAFSLRSDDEDYGKIQKESNGEKEENAG